MRSIDSLNVKPPQFFFKTRSVPKSPKISKPSLKKAFEEDILSDEVDEEKNQIQKFSAKKKQTVIDKSERALEFNLNIKGFQFKKKKSETVKLNWKKKERYEG